MAIQILHPWAISENQLPINALMRQGNLQQQMAAQRAREASLALQRNMELRLQMQRVGIEDSRYKAMYGDPSAQGAGDPSAPSAPGQSSPLIDGMRAAKMNQVLSSPSGTGPVEPPLPTMHDGDIPAPTGSGDSGTIPSTDQDDVFSATDPSIAPPSQSDQGLAAAAASGYTPMSPDLQALSDAPPPQPPTPPPDPGAFSFRAMNPDEGEIPYKAKLATAHAAWNHNEVAKRLAYDDAMKAYVSQAINTKNNTDFPPVAQPVVPTIPGAPSYDAAMASRAGIAPVGGTVPAQGGQAAMMDTLRPSMQQNALDEHAARLQASLEASANRQKAAIAAASDRQQTGIDAASDRQQRGLDASQDKIDGRAISTPFGTAAEVAQNQPASMYRYNLLKDADNEGQMKESKDPNGVYFRGLDQSGAQLYQGKWSDWQKANGHGASAYSQASGNAAPAMTPKQANKLPSGTIFTGTDGKQYKVP